MAIQDPVAEIDRIIEGLGQPKPKKKRPKQPSILPDLAEGEQEDMLSRLTGGVMSGLQYVGETLDKPGRALRGLLAGQPSELANLIPFSDTMGITDPSQGVSGRDLLEKAGMLGPNTVGELDVGDAVGFGAEILLDPLLLVSGPGKALTKAGKAKALQGTRTAAQIPGHRTGIKLPGDAIAHTPVRKTTEIAAGERGLIGLGLPGQDPLAMFTGPTAAKVYDWFNYNPVTRGFRHIFSANPWLKSFDKQLQRTADHEFAIYQDAVAGIQEVGLDLKHRMPQLQELLDNDLREYFEHNPDILRNLRGMAQARGEELNLDNLLRDMAENRTINDLDTVLDEAGEPVTKHVRKTQTLQDIITATDAQAPQNILQAAAHFDQFTNEILSLQDQLASQIKQMGGTVSLLDDAFIGHTARRMNPQVLDDIRKMHAVQGFTGGNRFQFWGGAVPFRNPQRHPRWHHHAPENQQGSEAHS